MCKKLLLMVALFLIMPLAQADIIYLYPRGLVIALSLQSNNKVTAVISRLPGTTEMENQDEFKQRIEAITKQPHKDRADYGRVFSKYFSSMALRELTFDEWAKGTAKFLDIKSKPNPEVWQVFIEQMKLKNEESALLLSSGFYNFSDCLSPSYLTAHAEKFLASARWYEEQRRAEDTKKDYFFTLESIYRVAYLKLIYFAHTIESLRTPSPITADTFVNSFKKKFKQEDVSGALATNYLLTLEKNPFAFGPFTEHFVHTAPGTRR